MPTHSVNDDIINSPEAEAYFTRADRRVMIGLRAALEMLRLPVPEYARRNKPGPTPAKAVAAAFAQDHPSPRSTTLSPRKPNASPERVVEAKATPAEGVGQPVFTPYADYDPLADDGPSPLTA